jgi:hypothetical protein
MRRHKRMLEDLDAASSIPFLGTSTARAVDDSLVRIGDSPLKLFLRKKSACGFERLSRHHG